MSLTFHLIPHTHWDREWYLPRAAFQARLVAAVSDLLALLESDPSARFVLDGQTILIEDALAVRPDWAPQLEAAVRRGQLEVGPWYVLADELIPSGESLLRNLLLGARDAKRLSGQVAVFVGADHHAPPRDLAALRERLQALEPEHRVRVSGLGELFAALEAEPNDAPEIAGELRRASPHAWILQGVHATRSRAKR